MEKAEGHDVFDRLLSQPEVKNSLKQPNQVEKGDLRCSSSVGPESHEEKTLLGQRQYAATDGCVSSPEVRGQSSDSTSGRSFVGNHQLHNGDGVIEFTAKRSALIERKKKKHVCHVCHRECPSKHKLKRHLSTHSEERPFSCQLCGKSFKWTEYLHKHMRQQHPGAVGGEGSAHTTSSNSSKSTTSSSTTPIPSTPTTIHSPLPPAIVSSPVPSSTNSHSPLPSTPTSLPSPDCETSNTNTSAAPTIAATNDVNTSAMISPTPTSTTSVVLTLAQGSSFNNSLSRLQSPSWTSSPQGQQNMSQQQQQQHQHQQQKQQMQQPRTLAQESHNSPQHQNQHLNVQIQHTQQQQQQQQNQPQFHQQQSMQRITNAGMSMMNTNCVSQVNQFQQLTQNTSQASNLIPQKQNASIGVNMDVSEMNTALLGGVDMTGVPSMGMNPTHMMSTSGGSMHIGAGSGGASNQINGVSQIIGEIQNDATAIGQNQGYTETLPSSTCLPQQQSISQSMVGGVAQQTFNHQLLQQSNINSTSDLQSLQQQMQATNPVQMSNQPSMSHSLPPLNSHPIPPPDLISDSHLSIPQDASNGAPSDMMQSLPHQFIQDSLVTPLYGTGSGNGTMNMVSQPTAMNYSTCGSGDGSMNMSNEMVATQSTGLNYAAGTANNTMSLTTDMASQSNALNYTNGSGDASMNMTEMVSQPTTLNYPMQMGQPATQTSNVYSTVPSYMEMPTQQMVYDNSQQNMMTHVQSGVMNDSYGVMQQSGLLTPAQQNVGMMNHSMYSQVGQGHEGHAMMMDQSQMQQQQQQQSHVMHNGYMPGLQDHMLQPTAQDTSHMTQLGDHMTAQSHDNHMMQFTQPQQQETNPIAVGNVNPLQEQISTTQTTEADFDCNTTATTIIIHDEDMNTEVSPVDDSLSRKNVGIQCEVGPETILALQEEEEEAVALEQEQHVHQQEQEQQHTFQQGGEENGVCLVQQQGGVDGGYPPDGETNTDRLVLKYPCESENCNKAYIHRKDLIRHMKNRHGISPKKLETIVMETREKPFICPVGTCRRSYFHMKDLRRHQRLCHNVNPESSMQSLSNGSGNEEDKTQLRYPCDFPGCLRSYVHKKDLIRHKRLYHKDPSQKPSIPLPIRYTELELKKIRQEVKQEIDKTVEKIRLDSTGSTITSSGDEPPNSATSIESSDMDLSTGGVLASTMIDQPPTSLSLNIVDSMQLALLIGTQPTTTTTATSAAQLSSNQVQLSDILAVASASTASSIKPLMTDVSLAQIINNAVQSGVVLSSTPPPLLQSDQMGVVNSESQDEDEATKISSEAAAIIRSLDESQGLTNVHVQGNEKTQQQQQQQLLANLSAAVVFPSNGETLFNVGSLLNGTTTTTSTVSLRPSVSTPSSLSTLTPTSEQTDSTELNTKPALSQKAGGDQYDPATVLVSKSSDGLQSLDNAASSLRNFFVANSSQEAGDTSQSSY